MNLGCSWEAGRRGLRLSIIVIDETLSIQHHPSYMTARTYLQQSDASGGNGPYIT